jgi:threonine dehydrogenase-like Zn-dependent dehydrogenase
VSQANHALAAVQVADRTIELQKLPLPATLGPNEALLKVEANGVCGTDVEQYNGLMNASGVVRYPQIPGHEAFGRIAWIGDEARQQTGVKEGDRVSVESTVPCWVCDMCRTGREKFCRQSRFMYGYTSASVDHGLWGGMAEYMVLRRGTVLHHIPDSLPTAIAAFRNPLAAGFEWALRAGGVGVGHRVVIFGPGQRGLGAVAASRRAGATQIIVTGLSSDVGKLELCRQFGATETIVAGDHDVVGTIREMTDGNLADVVLDLTPVATQPVLDALACVAPQGTIVLAGIKGRKPVDGLISDEVVTRGITIRGALPPSYWASEQALTMLAEEPERFAAIGTKLVPLPEAARGIRMLGGEIDAEKPMHVAIVPEPA